MTNSLTNGAFSVAGITFNAGAPAYTMTGNTFNLSAGVTNNSGVLQTFSNTSGLTDTGTAITFTVGTGGISFTTGLANSSNANQTTTVNGTGTLTLGSFMINASTATVTETFAGTSNITVTGAVGNGGTPGTNPNGLAYIGSGVLTLNGANTYTGATTLGQSTPSLPAYATGPTIELGNAGALGGNGAFNLYFGTFDNSTSGALALSSTNTVTLEANSFVTFGGTHNLNFGSGSTLAMNGNSVLNLGGSSSTLTLGAGINPTAGGIVDTVNGAGNTLVLSNFTISGTTAAANLTLGGNGNITLTGGLLGGSFPGGVFTYNGIGTVTMGGTSTGTGGTILTHGTLALTGTLSATGGVTVNGGILNESSTGVIPISSTSTDLTLNGGTSNFAGGAAILSGANTFAGTVSINPYSTLTVDYSGAASPSTAILPITGTINMSGGTLAIKGASGQASSMTIGKYTVASVVSAEDDIVFIQNGATSLGAALGNISRSSAGPTLDITFPTTGVVTTTDTGTTNGVFTSVANGVAYATANGGTSWVTINTGTLGALATYSTGAANYLSTNNVNVTNGDSVGSFTVGTLRFNSATDTLTMSGSGTVTTGGILVTPGSNATISSGTLTAGATGKELVFQDYGSLNVGSVVTNNGANVVSVTAAGPGVTTLSGANTYTGGTIMDNGTTLAVTNASGLGTGTVTMGFDSTLELRNDSNTNFGNSIVDGAGTINFDVNDVTSGVTGKTLSLGNITYSTQQQYNITGGNGYTLSTGTLTTAGTTSTGIAINPTTASVTIAGIVGNATGASLDTIRLDGTSSGTVTGVISNGASTGTLLITKSDSSTWTLTGANTYTGATTVGGGILNIGNGSTGNLINTGGTYSALVMNGTGVINFNEAAGIAQNMGALSFTSGDGTVESTYGGSSNTSVTFASLAARSAGATENYVITNGTNGSTNEINLTGAAAGFINQGAFFDGGTSSAGYAYMNSTGGYVRAINYSGDTNATTTAGTTSITPGTNLYFQTTGAVTAQATATMTTLNLAGTSTSAGQNDFTLASSATLTTLGILRSGNVSGSSSTISGGAGIAINGGDLVIRTDSANDDLTINTVISGAGVADNLVKSGSGTLTLGSLAVDTFYGNVYINQGTLNIAQDSNLGGYTGQASTVFLNGGTLQAGAANISLVANRNITLSAASGVQTIDTNGNTMTVNGVISGGIIAITSGGNVSPSVLNKVGTGTLVMNGTETYVSQTEISAGTLQLGNGGTSGAIIGTGAIIDNGVLAFDRSNTVTQGYDFLPLISGTGAVSQIGSGTVIMNAANTYTGGTTISGGGTLVVAANNTLATTGAVTLGESVGNTSGIFQLGTSASAYNQTVSSLTTAGSGSTNAVVGGNSATSTLTVNNSSTDTYAGKLGGAGTNQNDLALAVTGTGGFSITSGSNTYTGGTSVSTAAKLFVNNSTGTSALGTGALVVAQGATFGGSGSATGLSSFVIGGAGTQASVIVGNGTDTTSGLTLSGTGANSITNTKLSFNISATTPGQGNTLSVGTSGIAFSSSTLALNVVGTGIIPAYQPYVLVAGTGTNQYTGLGTSMETINGTVYDVITSGLSLSFAPSLANTWYAGHSFLFLNTASGVDDIDVEVVPEPSTWAMMAGGLAALLFWQRRKSRQS